MAKNHRDCAHRRACYRSSELPHTFPSPEPHRRENRTASDIHRIANGLNKQQCTPCVWVPDTVMSPLVYTLQRHGNVHAHQRCTSSDTIHMCRHTHKHYKWLVHERTCTAHCNCVCLCISAAAAAAAVALCTHRQQPSSSSSSTCTNVKSASFDVSSLSRRVHTMTRTRVEWQHGANCGDVCEASSLSTSVVVRRRSSCTPTGSLRTMFFVSTAHGTEPTAFIAGISMNSPDEFRPYPTAMPQNTHTHIRNAHVRGILLVLS